MIAFSLVLPVLNEADIIGPVVRDIQKVLRGMRISYEIILAENGSTDGTAGVVRRMAKKDPHLRVVVTPRGYGRAILGGLEAAKGRLVAYMPSDGQIDPACLPQLIRAVRDGGHDLAGIRRTTRESMVRKYNSAAFNLLFTTAFALPVRDINGDPKVFPRLGLQRLNLESTDSFLSTELLIKAHALGWRMTEFPSPGLVRAGGKSTVSYRTVFEFLQNLRRWRWGGKLAAWKKSALAT